MANFQWERLLMALGAVASMERGSGPPARAPSPAVDGGTRVAEMAVKHEAARASPTTRSACSSRTGTRSARSRRRSCCHSARRSRSPRRRSGVLDGDLEIGRAMRDTRLGPIGGGTDEVMKEILAKQLGL